MRSYVPLRRQCTEVYLLPSGRPRHKSTRYGVVANPTGASIHSRNPWMVYSVPTSYLPTLEGKAGRP